MSRSFDLTVLSLPRFIINLLPPDCLPILTVLFQCCTRKVYFSLLFLVISTFALLMYFSILKWKNSGKRSLLMVILQHLLIVVSNHFLIKCITLEIKFILALKRLYIFVFLSLVIMVCKFDHNFRNFFLLLIHKFPSFRLSNFFPFKDKIPCELRSHVVYLYKCQCCGALYVGQTRRHIHTRISEHMGVSPLTGKKRSVSTMSGILAHIHTTKHQISPSDFKILSTATSEADLLIRESLFISKLNPILNANIIGQLL